MTVENSVVFPQKNKNIELPYDPYDSELPYDPAVRLLASQLK